MNEPKCEACGGRALVRKRVYRTSGVAVVVGYVLLASSLLGLLAAIALFLVSGDATTKDLSQKLRDDVAEDLMKAGVPRGIIDRVTDLQEVSDADEEHLTSNQKGAVRSGQARMAHRPLPEFAVWLTMAAARVGSLYVGAFSLVGALLGWLLVRKRPAWTCTHCGARAPAT
jgi:hypothetical protein